MKWKLSGILADVHGKFGGSTVFNGRTGLIMRNVRKGKNPRSTTQIARRGAFTTASQGWRDLTEAQIASWKAAAKDRTHKNAVGAGYQSSGSALYAAVNDSGAFVNACRALAGGGAAVTLPIVSPPTLDNPTPTDLMANLVAKNVGGVQTLTIDKPTVAADDICVLEATPMMSAGRSFFKGKYRPITAFAVGVAAPGTDILTEYQAIFGDLVAGQMIAIRSRFYNKVGQAPIVKYANVELSGKVKAI